jgi:hypothetical protein
MNGGQRMIVAMRYLPCSNHFNQRTLAAAIQGLILVTAAAAAVPVVESAHLRSSMHRSLQPDEDFNWSNVPRLLLSSLQQSESKVERHLRGLAESVTSAATTTDAPTQDEGSINMAIIVVALFVVFVLIYIWFCYCLCCCGYVIFQSCSYFLQREVNSNQSYFCLVQKQIGGAVFH